MSKLYVIPTPIGNLEDITLRSIRILKEVDLILAEDTRVSKKLLNQYKIKNQLSSNHQYNEHKKLPTWIKKLKKGISIGLISDAGTPAISDPGFLLIRECIKEQIEVQCLPGATAFIPALVSSGLSCNKFVFEGFLPAKKGRNTRLEVLSEETRTIIFYESPHKIIKTLTQFIIYFGEERRASLSREISKFYEEITRGTIKSILEYFKQYPPKGEFVIILDGKK